MKRLTALVLLTAILLWGCGKAEEAGKKWDCSVSVVSEDATAIVYSEAQMQTNSGQLSFQNRNAFPIYLYLYSDGGLVHESEITPGGAVVFFQISPEKEYTVGIHAEQPVGTKINVMAYDGNMSQEPYTLEWE